MKVLSVLFLGLVFFGVFAPNLTLAANSFYVLAVHGNENCLYQVVLTSTGIKIKRIECWVDPRGDTVSSAIKCDEEEFFTGLKCYLYIGASDSSSGTTKRTVGVSSFTNNGNVTDAQVLSSIIPSSFFSMQTTDISDVAASSTDNGAAAALNRLFIAGSQGTAGANDYLSFALNAEGLTTGAKSTIFSNPNTKTTLGGSISRDGGMAVQLSATSALWQLSTRLLNNGVPRKAPVSWTVLAYNGYSPDITNRIEVNSGVAGASAIKIQYLVFRAFRGVGTAAQQSQIMIQRIDDATGKPLETAKPLTVFKNAFLAPAEAFQSIAIAPNGEVMIFTEYSGACKKMILKAVKLVNGAVSGPAKLIAGCAGLASSTFGYTGLDITEDPESESP